MKAWLLALIGFMILIGFAVYSLAYLQQSSAQVILREKRVEQSIMAHRWPEASHNFSVMKHHWENVRPWWAILIHHQEIDNIDNALVQLEKALRCHDTNNSLMSSGELTHFLQHIPQREKFTLVNIL